MVAKADECDIPGCIKMAAYVISPDLQVCATCYQKKNHINSEAIRNSRKVKPTWIRNLDAHKMEKIVETYLDLAEAIQNGGVSVSVIKDHRHKPLGDFLENVCSTNNIRFKHDKNGS